MKIKVKVAQKEHKDFILKGDYNLFCKYVNENKSEKTYAMVFDGEGKGLDVKFFTYGKKDDYRDA